ncbi:toll-like receptor 13 [Poeciliopsis prolifica]|uniref:toll-like receptor 13 n=1 Tax=Poeciliopsis prolifica TaxID=188132 RepID=UPI002414186E|nr:toll-like receptor 13 [Poeciliopsis prolifica]
MALHSNFILRLFFLLLHINLSLTYSLKNCSILYEDNPSAGVSVDCVNRNLISIPDDIPKEAVSIELRRNNIQSIKDDFHGMSRLRYLGLRKNSITSVDDGCFNDLVSLETLMMRNNNLYTLTANMFQGLSNLTTLDLSYNGICFIHGSAFRFLTSLKVLNLDYNVLKNTADIQPIFQLPQIQKLSLRCNDLLSFESKNFLLNKSSSLQQLFVSGDSLRKFSITSPIFPYLQVVELSTCSQVTKLKWDISDKTLLENITQFYVEENVLSFKGVQNVMQNLISLRHFKVNMVLSWLKRGLLTTVCKIQSLRRLDLFYNNMKNVTSKLAPCSQLTELYLQVTNLNELTNGSIQSMKMLQVLNMSDNKLTRVSYDIRRLAFLKILHLDNNFISKLDCEDFENTTHLVELNLNTNQIPSLEKCVLEHLTELKHLDLGYNKLGVFGDTFKVALHKLEFLDMSENDIKEKISSNTFEGLQSLRHLNMASDDIIMIETFPEFRNLVDLNVSFPSGYKPELQGLQRLENLTVYFGKGFTFKNTYQNKHGGLNDLKLLKSLTVICCKDFPCHKNLKEMLQAMGHLEAFEAVDVFEVAPDVDTFQFNPHLSSLTLTNTDMSDVKPELFRPIPNLQRLDLTNSMLRSMDFLLQANLSALKYLKLTDNKIIMINEAVWEALPSLTYLDLSYNLFTCECSNAGFIQWVKANKQTQVVDAFQYQCSFPVSKEGTLLLDFHIQSCFNNASFLCFISTTCLVVLTLLTSLVYHFLRQHLVYAFHLFLAFLYDTKRKKKNDGHQFDAFVSYNVHDEDWVYREMIPVLEGQQGWRLCLHHRDFQPGKPIIENITDAIYCSRKTICVISRSYLQSEWCSNEFQMASFRLFDEKKDVLILLFLEEIPAHHLSPYYLMRKVVKKRTYLSWPQAAQHPGVFWKNVQRALQAEGAVAEPVLAARCRLRSVQLPFSNELPQGSMDSMRQIRFFNVSYNRLKKIPHDIRSLSSLEILIINDNIISHLGCEDFLNNTHLTELHLNGNRIAKLQRCVMESLTNLKFLNLSGNLLVTFRASTNVGLQKLEILDLSLNFIKCLNNYDFQGLRSLKHLNLTSYFRENLKYYTFLGLKSLKSFSGSIELYSINLRTLPQLEKIQVNFNYNEPFRTPHLNPYEDSIEIKSLKSVLMTCRSDHKGLFYFLTKGVFRNMKHLEYFKAENIYLSAPYSDTFKFNQKLRSLIFTKTDLSEIQPELFLPIPNLESLDLSESQLKSLDFLVQANLSALRYLKLTGNELSVINTTVFQSLHSLTFLDLDKNPFTCDCSNADFIQWVKSNTQTQVVNADQYVCSFPVSRRGTLLLDFNFQPCLDDGGFLCFVSSSCLVVLTLLSSFIYHFLRWHLTYTFHLLLAFLYNSRKGRRRDLHQFDAFVSYNVHDEGWVHREMLPVLEGQQGWRLCLHHRDFQPGKAIIENITDAIYGSRKTICVISRSYLQSEWCSREIQMASFRLFDEKKDVLILLFLEDIPAHHLSPYYRMRKLVKKRTYLSWPQAAQHPAVFWQNVQRALQAGGDLAESTNLLTGPAGR